MSEPLRPVVVVRGRGGARAEGSDRTAVEEPLEIRLHDRPFAVIMRTPGADRELAAGFLLAERGIAATDDLGTIRHCADTARAAHAAPDGVSDRPSNIVNVTLADAAAGAIE